MNQKTQYDPNGKTRDVDIPKSNVLRVKERKKKNKKSPNELKTLAMVTQHVARKQRINRRLMYTDVGYGITSPQTVGVNTTTTFGNLLTMTTGIPQGAGQAARTGDTIWLTRLIFHLALQYNFSSTVLAQDFVQTIRMTVLQWIPNSALVAVTPASIFQNVTSTSVFSLFDFELKDNYRVLKDEFITVSGFYDSTTAFALPNSHSLRIMSYDIPLNNCRVDYSPGATTAANHLYIAFTCDAVTGPSPLIELVGRTYYYNDNA